MLPLSIIVLLFALFIVGFTAVGGIGAGAIMFAVGFMLIGMIAMLQFLRSRKPTPF